VLRRNACDRQPTQQPRPLLLLQENLNNIDLLLTVDYDFRAAVALLERWLKHYQAQQTKQKTPTRRRGRKEVPTLLWPCDVNDPLRACYVGSLVVPPSPRGGERSTRVKVICFSRS
jgi:hypothetical protein